jgi:hypothetical protein
LERVQDAVDQQLFQPRINVRRALRVRVRVRVRDIPSAVRGTG